MIVLGPPRCRSRAAAASALLVLLVGGPTTAAQANDAPLPPTGLAARTASGLVTLTWTPDADADVTGYDVRIVASGQDVGAAAPVGRAAAARWVQAPLLAGSYDVTVQAVTDEGALSAPSAPLRVDVLAPAPGPGNLLTINQGSVEASSAGFEASTTGATFARSLAAADDGTSSLAVLARVAGRTGVMTSRGWTPVVPGASYSASVDVRPGPTVPSGRAAAVRVRWWRADGRPLSTTSCTWTALVPGRFTTLRLAARPAPAGSATASVELLVEGAAAGERFQADRWGLWQRPTVPVWTRGTVPTGPFAVVLGDSYAVGSGASAPAARWSSQVWAQKGWREVNLARGGSGYAAGSDAACGFRSCGTILGSTSAAIAARPSLVVVTGGRNDLALLAADPERVHAAVTATYSRLRSALPSARIVAVTPMWDTTEPPASLETLAGWVREAAAAQSAEVVDGSSAWLLGCVACAAPDGIHPDDEGHRQLAWRLLRSDL